MRHKCLRMLFRTTKLLTLVFGISPAAWTSPSHRQLRWRVRWIAPILLSTAWGLFSKGHMAAADPAPGTLPAELQSTLDCRAHAGRGCCTTHAQESTPSLYGLGRRANLCELPSVLGVAHARSCLRDRTVLLLGDSTMTETAHDIAVLLAQLGHDEAEQYLRNATRSSQPSALDLGDAGTASFYPNHRNMTIHIAASNTTLIHRFTGHHNISLNTGGTATFSAPEFQEELSCLLGEAVGCRTPDIILVNSGLHDHNPSQFRMHCARIAARLRARNRPFIFWRGCNFSPSWRANNTETSLVTYDNIAQSEFVGRGLGFINVSNVMVQLLCQWGGDITQFTPDGVHFGAIAFYHDEGHDPGISAYSSQAVLAAICAAMSAAAARLHDQHEEPTSDGATIQAFISQLLCAGSLCVACMVLTYSSSSTLGGFIAFVRRRRRTAAGGGVTSHLRGTSTRRDNSI